MGRNTNTIDYREDYYKGFAKIYFNTILQIIIDFGKLKNESGLILDYGCGFGHLKIKLNRPNVVGYDIIPELSDINDYRNLKPQKIVLSNVLEHLYLDEIDSLLKEFVKMNSTAELLVSLPTENFVSKIAKRLSGLPSAHDDHVSKYKQINQLIEKYYYPNRRKYIFLKMSQITKYVPINK
ncbi:MAG: methyltransferase domain-containing protein [Patescibacteria group bacterium]